MCSIIPQSEIAAQIVNVSTKNNGYQIYGFFTYERNYCYFVQSSRVKKLMMCYLIDFANKKPR